MGIIDKFKNLAGIEDIEDDEYEQEVKAAKESKPVDRGHDRKALDINKAKSFASSQRAQTSAEGKVLNMQNRTGGRHTNAFKLVVIEPDGSDECPKLVDSLKARKPVIINLEKVESDTARKIFDFLSGATYALNGNVQKVANNIFVFAPENVDIAEGMEKTNFDFNNLPKNSSSNNSPWR